MLSGNPIFCLATFGLASRNQQVANKILLLQKRPSLQKDVINNSINTWFTNGNNGVFFVVFFSFFFYFLFFVFGGWVPDHKTTKSFSQIFRSFKMFEIIRINFEENLRKPARLEKFSEHT